MDMPYLIHNYLQIMMNIFIFSPIFWSYIFCLFLSEIFDCVESFFLYILDNFFPVCDLFFILLMESSEEQKF